MTNFEGDAYDDRRERRAKTHEEIARNRERISQQEENKRFIEKPGKFSFGVLLKTDFDEELPIEHVAADNHREAIKKAQLIALSRPHNGPLKFNDSACKAKNSETGKVYSFEDPIEDVEH